MRIGVANKETKNGSCSRNVLLSKNYLDALSVAVFLVIFIKDMHTVFKLEMKESPELHTRRFCARQLDLLKDVYCAEKESRCNTIHQICERDTAWKKSVEEGTNTCRHLNCGL